MLAEIVVISLFSSMMNSQVYLNNSDVSNMLKVDAQELPVGTVERKALKNRNIVFKKTSRNTWELKREI